MKIKLICFTQKGAETCNKIITGLKGHVCRGYEKGTFSHQPGLERLSTGLSAWTEEGFSSEDALVFIGATGIAVRAIAPWIKSKTEDPACLVVDEQGNYVIPLLSGHIGGANALAEEIAAVLEAVPVITTATDLNHLFAVDQWAKKQGFWISSMKLAKQVSAQLLQGKKIGVISEFPIKGTLPAGLIMGDGQETAIEISFRREVPKEGRLLLIPRCIALGIGCRKGIDAEAVKAAVEQTLERFGISQKAVKCAASIDLKEKEAGLLQFCREWEIPFRVFSAGQLAQVKGSFTPSAFVNTVTGVDNVCERAAAAASGGGRILVKKQAQDGVTVAAAVEEIQISFSEKNYSLCVADDADCLILCAEQKCEERVGR